MGILSKIKEILSKDKDRTLGQVAIINPDFSISIYTGFDELIKMLEKDSNTNKIKIEKLKLAKSEFGKQKKSGTGAIRISEHGEITEYKSIDELKKDLNNIK